MKDANGNELFQNALCHVKVGGEWLQGRVTELKPGGAIIAMAKGNIPVISPAIVKVNCEVGSSANPREPVFGDIVLLVDPTPKLLEGVKTN